MKLCDQFPQEMSCWIFIEFSVLPFLDSGNGFLGGCVVVTFHCSVHIWQFYLASKVHIDSWSAHRCVCEILHWISQLTTVTLKVSIQGCLNNTFCGISVAINKNYINIYGNINISMVILDWSDNAVGWDPLIINMDITKEIASKLTRGSLMPVRLVLGRSKTRKAARLAVYDATMIIANPAQTIPNTRAEKLRGVPSHQYHYNKSRTWTHD